VWFHSLQLLSIQSESPLAPKRHMFSKHVLKREQNFSFLIFLSGLSDIWIDCNRISECLL
jgi:hypothetical protein